MDRQTNGQNYDSQDRASIAASCGNNNDWGAVFMHFTRASVLQYTVEANSWYSVYSKIAQ